MTETLEQKALRLEVELTVAYDLLDEARASTAGSAKDLIRSLMRNNRELAARVEYLTTGEGVSDLEEEEDDWVITATYAPDWVSIGGVCFNVGEEVAFDSPEAERNGHGLILVSLDPLELNSVHLHLPDGTHFDWIPATWLRKANG